MADANYWTNLLNANSKNPYVRTIWPGGHRGVGAKCPQISELPPSRGVLRGSSKMNKGLSIEFLLANDDIPNRFLYPWSLNQHPVLKYGTDVKVSCCN